MPYSITTKDGITIQNIPDDVPSDSPLLRERVAKARSAAGGASAPTLPASPPAAPPAAPTSRDELLSSVPMRVARGMKDPIDAAAQLASRVPGAGFVNSAADAAGGFLNKQVFNRLGLPGDFAGEVLGIRGAKPEQIDAELRDAEQEYQKARTATSQDPGTDWARIGGNILSPANAAIAGRLPTGVTTLGRAGAGAAGGALGGALNPVTSGEGDFWSQKGAQTALGAITGGITAPIMGKVADKVGETAKRLGERLSQRSKTVDPLVLDQTMQKALAGSGQRFEDLSEASQNELREQATDALRRSGGRMDSAALMRQSDFAAEGMDPTLGQITRDAAQYAKERNLRTMPGAGDPLLQRFEQQGKQLREKVGEFATGSSDNVTGGEKLVEALRTFDAAKSKEISAAYKVARDSAGKDAEVPMGGLASDFADVLDRFGDKVPSGVRNQFAKFGIDPDVVSNQKKLFTVEEADKLLKVINDNVGSDKATNTALTQLRNSVKKSIVDDAGVEDVFSPARKAAAARFKLQEAVPALEAAANGTTAPDDFVRRFVLNGKAAEVQGMAKVLKEASPEALDEARAQVGSHLQRAAFGENAAGDKAFSPERYAKALRDLGDRKLNALFTEDQVKQMHRLSRIGAYISAHPDASPVQTSNNWGAITKIAGRIPGLIPGVGAVADLAKGAKTIVDNQRAVDTALQAKIPQQATKLTAEQARRLGQMLSLGAMGAGAATGGAVQ